MEKTTNIVYVIKISMEDHETHIAGVFSSKIEADVVFDALKEEPRYHGYIITVIDMWEYHLNLPVIEGFLFTPLRRHINWSV